MFILPVRWYRFLMVGLFTLLGVVGLWLPSQLGVALSAPSSTITVNSPADIVADDGVCTLREAITAANTDTPSGASPGECGAGSGADTIVFSDTNAPFTVTLAITGTREDANATGDLDIFSDLTIQGNPAFTTTIDANQLDRVLDVLTGTSGLSNLVIANGVSAPCQDNFPNPNLDGESGGGIRNSGNLALEFVMVFNNRAGTDMTGPFGCGSAGHGGGIWNSGLFTATYSHVISNSAGLGYSALRDGADGGGIYNLGTTTLFSSTIERNDAGNLLYTYYGMTGTGGSGGGIYNLATLTITDSIIAFNSAGHGPANAGDFGGDGRKGGDGGGIYNSGSATITHSDIVLNIAGRGAGATGARYSGGMGGNGGGIFATSGVLKINYVTLAYNTSGRGGRGSSGDCVKLFCYEAGSGGASGNGGALAISNQGQVFLNHSTLYQNASPLGGLGGGCSWGCPPGPNGWAGSGAAIFANGTLSISNSTLSNNTSHRFGGAIYNTARQASITIQHSTIAYNTASQWGAGILTSNLVTMTNSILAKNIAPIYPDCVGDIYSQGFLLLETVNLAACPITGDESSNVYGHDPYLLPLGDNGGATLTHALDITSPAMDAGNCPPDSTDQRDEPRPFDIEVLANTGNGCDIGAFEAQDLQNVPTRTPTVTPTPSPTPTATPTPTTTLTSTVSPTQPPTLYLPLIQRHQQL